MEVRVLLHNVRSAHNVGSIFRTADAAGVSKMWLSGYTPRPVDAFGRVQKDIAKTALGAEQFLAWEYAKDPMTMISKARFEGFSVVGIEQDARAQDYRTFIPGEKTLMILGNEVRGISPSLRTACDLLLEIPMRGKKESLNVAVAAGIVLFNTQKR